jgi:hypothetical protein
MEFLVTSITESLAVPKLDGEGIRDVVDVQSLCCTALLTVLRKRIVVEILGELRVVAALLLILEVDVGTHPVVAHEVLLVGANLYLLVCGRASEL